jgi:hypothetical protein
MSCVVAEMRNVSSKPTFQSRDAPPEVRLSSLYEGTNVQRRSNIPKSNPHLHDPTISDCS